MFITQVPFAADRVKARDSALLQTLLLYGHPFSFPALVYPIRCAELVAL
jgi:hypothetical protein